MPLAEEVTVVLPRTYFYDAKGNATGISGVLDADETERWVSNKP